MQNRPATLVNGKFKNLLADEMYQLPKFEQLVTTRQLNQIALQTNMKMVYQGRLFALTYTKIAPGVYRLYKVWKDMP